MKTISRSDPDAVLNSTDFVGDSSNIRQMNKVHGLPVWTAGSKIDESWGYRNIVAAEKAFDCALKLNIILVDKIDIDLLSFMRGKQNKIYMLFN